MMDKYHEIYSFKVSYQVNTWSLMNSEPSIETVLADIKSDKYRTVISELRIKLLNGDKEFYDSHKKKLPAVTFSGTFNERRTYENIKTYNPIIVIDIDKLGKQDISTTYSVLKNEMHVFAFWISPSNHGFKGLVSIDYRFKTSEVGLELSHRSAFNKLYNYFKESYNIELDKSGSDITRLCFLSFDENLIQKKAFDNFMVTVEDILVKKKEPASRKQIRYSNNNDALFNPDGRNNQFDRKAMSDIIRYLQNKNLSITYSYEEWCKVGMAIANSFTFEVGLNYFLKLSSMDATKFDETTCTNFLRNCYDTRKGNVQFSSIVYLANAKGCCIQLANATPPFLVML